MFQQRLWPQGPLKVQVLIMNLLTFLVLLQGCRNPTKKLHQNMDRTMPLLLWINSAGDDSNGGAGGGGDGADAGNMRMVSVPQS